MHAMTAYISTTYTILEGLIFAAHGSALLFPCSLLLHCCWRFWQVKRSDRLCSEASTCAGTCILFGDGAGAAVLSARADGPEAVLGSDMRSDGKGYCHLNAPLDAQQAGKPQSTDKRSNVTAFDNIHMSGQDVYKFAVRAVPDTLLASLADAGLASADIDWLVMHQANKRILDAAAKKLGIDSSKVSLCCCAVLFVHFFQWGMLCMSVICIQALSALSGVNAPRAKCSLSCHRTAVENILPNKVLVPIFQRPCVHFVPYKCRSA